MHSPWLITDTKNQTYWSGINASLYFENILIDEIVQLTYSVPEMTKPYWGYASYTPDRINHGTRMVNGQFSINFKKEGWILAALKEVSKPISTQTASQKDDGKVPGGFIGNILSGANQAIKAASQKWSGSQIKNYIQAAAQAGVEVSDLSKSKDNSLFYTQEDGFDLKIVFGGGLQAAIGLVYDPLTDFYTTTAMQTKTSPDTPKTGIKIVGTEIMSVDKMIDDSGKVIIETYAFMAKDIETLSSVDIQGIGNIKKNIESATVGTGNQIVPNGWQILGL